MKNVRMPLPNLSPGDADSVCHFVGCFARNAHEQGWTDEELRGLLKFMTALRAVQELPLHAEQEDMQPRTWLDRWRRQAQMLGDYAAGGRILVHDSTVEPSIGRWWLRTWRDAWKERVEDAHGGAAERPKSCV